MSPRHDDEPPIDNEELPSPATRERAARPADPEVTDIGEFSRARLVVAEPDGHPQQIGRYRIVGVLGQGGMGTVYLAEQSEPIRRQVAIKLIRASRRGAQLEHRFEAERQVLARMSHPCIAQVYEAGDTERGQPYFVMEHVPGVPITEYCDREKLTIEQRLDLFVAVCRGIHHAHQKGILHRDIKPPNILVATEQGRPVAKIIDFGVAKILDAKTTESPETVLGVVLGTPSYLSPESLAASTTVEAADVDTRSDVYALGVLLFELLVGERPFGSSGESIARILRQVAEDDVPPPSTRVRFLADAVRETRAAQRGTTGALLLRRLRGDLDWIVGKATARQRDLRYDSAAELAADVERHRRLEPVHAGPPGRIYVLGKFVRRYRVAVIAAGVVLLSLAAGIAARTLEARRANRAAAEARQAQGETQQVVDFLVDLFRVNEPGTNRGATITARELLDRGAEQIGTQLNEQPLTRARLLDTIGQAYRALEVSAPAEPLFRDALAIREQRLGAEHPDVATSLDHLGDLLWIRANYPEAEAALTRALAIREKLFGPDDVAVANVLDHLGSVYEIQGRRDEAEPLLRRALAIREQALGPDSLEVSASLDDLGVLELDRTGAAAAEPLFRRALAIREAKLHPDDSEIAVTANGLAIALFRSERYDESLAFHQRALEIREKAFGPDSPSVAQSLNNVSNVYIQLGRLEESEAALLRAAAIWENALGPDHPRIAIVKYNLADTYLQQGEPDRAEPLFRRAAEIFEKVHGAADGRLAVSLKGVADSLRAQGRVEESRPFCERAVAILEKSAGPEDAQTVEARASCNAPAPVVTRR